MEETDVVAVAQEVAAEVETKSGLLSSISSGINDTFSGPLKSIFGLVDRLFIGVDPSVYKFFAVGLFVCTILWVMLILKKEYVNVDQPKKGLLYDLRIWTLVSMSPHMIIYWIWS